ncbi:50S ribosomal protein L11 [Candidatus Pacearchaeota archaeon]|nr:50S ribosomal protein L11 [Candidatus Pacearchaeota archaeon]
MIIKLLIDGGDMKPNAAISQKLGPLGINIGKVISDVNKATSGFKGMKVPVELDVNPKTKSFSVSVFSPPTAELLKKELGIELASGMAKKLKVGNLSIEQIIKIAKIKQENMTSSSLKAAVRSVVGSCVSLGILIENKEAKEIEKEILQGVYDSEINSEKSEASEDKKKNLSEFFSKLKSKQDEMLKKEEEAKKAEEEAKAAKTAAPGALAAAAPAAGAKPDAGKPAEAKKEEVKKK